MAKRTYTRARKSVSLPLQSVVQLISELHTAGHTEQLKDHLKDKDLSVTLSPKVVNAFKDYIADNKLHTKNPTLSAALESAAPDYDCHYHEGQS